MNVKDHYDSHLADIYSWMMGDFGSCCNYQQELMLNYDLDKLENKTAIDLGAGNGIYSIPIAQLGFDVTAIDFNDHLLEELKLNSDQLSINVVNDDIRNVIQQHNLYPGIVICGGDTISHLDSVDEVGQFIFDVSTILVEEGVFYLSFRDYSHELTDTSRFIPVKSDENRVHTCFLEYFEDKIKITDLLNERNGFAWKQRVSSYYKVRITTNMITDFLVYAGFVIDICDVHNGMTYIKAVKSF
jgi:SAM-dependent methyltransferase